jgi:hypothetical protein
MPKETSGSFITDRAKNKREPTSGQSTVEFVLVLALVFTFFLFYLQVSMVSAVGSYIQYATFMSARALLPARASAESQEAAAAKVLKTMLKRGGQDRFKMFLQGDPSLNQADVAGAAFGPGPILAQSGQGRPSRDSSWQQGVRYTFKGNLTFMALRRTGESKIKLTSETWLGREEPWAESGPAGCVEKVKTRGGQPPQQVYYDNGC